MNTLLVEDIDLKASEVIRFLESQVSGIKISRAKSFLGAMKEMRSKEFDLLILDLNLPIRDGEDPLSDGGRRILAEILEGQIAYPPSYVVALTAYKDVGEMVSNEFEQSLLHVINYDEFDGRWKGLLSGKIKYLSQCLVAEKQCNCKFKTDLAIVTSSPHVELLEVLRLPGGFVAEHVKADSMHYYSSVWKSDFNRDVSVVACAAPTMGMSASCLTASKVLRRFAPRFLVMTGIAAGTRDDQSYGDILVAESCYDYGSGKILDGKGKKRVFVPSPNQLPVDPDVHAILQELERDQRFISEIEMDLARRNASKLKMRLGIIASGAAVVQSRSLVDEVLGNSRKVVGLEMEAYGIFHAAHLASEPRPKVIVAKSISDFANEEKSDDWQQYAAATSARFIHCLFTRSGEVIDLIKSME